MEPSTSACHSGIYAITNTINGKQYIGSAVNIRKRWNIHLHHLRHETHHSQHLQHAWNKYGEDAFTFTVLEIVSNCEDLVAREQWYIDARYAERMSHEYNIAPHAGNTLGVKYSPEARAKLTHWIGRKHSKETLRKMSENRKGRRHTPEARARMSAIKASRPPSDAWLTAMDQMRGQKHSTSRIAHQKEAAARRSLRKDEETLSALSSLPERNPFVSAWQAAHAIADKLPELAFDTIYGRIRRLRKRGWIDERFLPVDQG